MIQEQTRRSRGSGRGVGDGEMDVGHKEPKGDWAQTNTQTGQSNAFVLKKK